MGRGGRELEDDSEHGKLSRGIKRAVDVTRAGARKLADNAEWIFGTRAARVLGVVALFVVVVVALLLVFLNWYVAPTKPSEKKDLVLALAQILGGTAVLSGLYFTWRTLQINREGQITERFTRAIDQLGKVDEEGDKLFEIRLGGIYALERIARESEEDYWPIMEVLTAYVRQHAPLGPEQDQEGEEDATVENSEEDSGDPTGGSEPTEVPAPAPDIQAILTVIARRKSYYGDGETEPLDLQGTDLRGSSALGAGGVHLESVILHGSDLREADLQGANLQGANLWRANLQGAYLQGAYLQGAYLQQANLQGAKVTDEQLADVLSLQGATMPDGQKYEDWLKDKQGSGKDVENE